MLLINYTEINELYNNNLKSLINRQLWLLNYILEKEFLLWTNDRAWTTDAYPCDCFRSCKLVMLHDEASNQGSSATQTSCSIQQTE